MTISERGDRRHHLDSVFWEEKVRYLNEKPVILVPDTHHPRKKRPNVNRLITYEEIRLLMNRAILDLLHKPKVLRYSRRIESIACNHIFAVIKKVANLVLCTDQPRDVPTTGYEGRLMASHVLNQLEGQSPSSTQATSIDDLDEKQRYNPHYLTVGEFLELTNRDWESYGRANVFDLIVGKKGFISRHKVLDVSLYRDRIKEFGVVDCSTLCRVLHDWGRMDELASEVWNRFFAHQNELGTLTASNTISWLQPSEAWSANPRNLLKAGGPLYLRRLKRFNRITNEEMNLAGIGTQEKLEKIIDEYCQEKQVDPSGENIVDVITWQMMRQQELIFSHRSMTTNRVSELLAQIPQDDEEGQLWIEQVSAAYDVRPMCVIEAISKAQLSPLQVKLFMRELPEVLYPFPEESRSVLTTLTYQESLHAIEKAPDLFLLFPSSIQRRIVNDFHKNHSLVRNAMISMFEYPPLWEILIPHLSSREVYWLVEHSTLMKILKKEITDIAQWKSFVDFITRDDPTKKEAIQKGYCLGRNYWKLLVAQQDTAHGHMVYDKGYHGGDVEPGYLRSMKAGLLWVLYCSTQNLSPESEFLMYKTLHDIVLSHTKSPTKHLFRSEYEKKVGVKVPACGIIESPGRVYRAFRAEAIGVTIHPCLCKILAVQRRNPNNVPRYVELQFSYKTAPSETQLVSLFALTQQELRRDLQSGQRLLQIARKHQILEVNHPFVDGNSRTHFLVLIGDLIKEKRNPTLANPNGSYLLPVEAWAEEIESNIAS